MAITIDQATADKTGATARAYAAQNRASNSTKPITIEQATADKTGATARAFAAQNVANKANIIPSGTVGNTLTSSNMRPTTPISVTQPQIATGSTMLATDIISKGQADTARAMAEEARVAQQQGMAAPTATSDVIKNILAQSSGTPTNTSPQGTQSGTEPINVNGITADTLASQRQGIQDAITNQATEAGLRSSVYGEAVDPAQKELNDINSRINDEALAGRRRAEAVLTIPGITKAQASDKINEINRVNASQLADLAVVQMAKQGQYDSAREIADRAIDARLEEQKNRNQALLFTYQENKELFTKAEQRDFEAEQKKRDREYETEKQTLTQISNLALSALESGAPTSVVSRMQKAKTLAEATSIGGQYVGKLDRQIKQAQLSKIYADIAESRATADAKKSNLVLTPYKAAVAQSDIQSIDSLIKSPGVQGKVGTGALGRTPTTWYGNVAKAIATLGTGTLRDIQLKTSGANADFVAGVNTLKSQITLDALQKAKESGVTFGSLTEGERAEVARSGSKIASWEIKDSQGNVLGYNTSEESMQKELSKINNFKKLDYISRGGNPLDIGATVLADGSVIVANADGTFTQLK